MCRQKESKTREREEKGNFGSSTHSSGYDSSFLSFLSASLSNTRSSYSSTGFSLFFSVFFFFSFPRYPDFWSAKGNKSRSMASSIRSFYQVCCRSYYLRVSTFFPFSPLSLIPGLFLLFVQVSFYRTVKNRTQFSSTLIEFRRPKLLRFVERRFLCIQLIFSPDLLRRVSRFCQQEQATSVLTKCHESFRGGKPGEKKKNKTVSPFTGSWRIDFCGRLLLGEQP